jgi:hypothetical protein
MEVAAVAVSLAEATAAGDETSSARSGVVCFLRDFPFFSSSSLLLPLLLSFPCFIRFGTGPLFFAKLYTHSTSVIRST